jgi:TolA-binding protein
MVKSVVISKDMQIAELSERLEQAEKHVEQLQETIQKMRSQSELSK